MADPEGFSPAKVKAKLPPHASSAACFWRSVEEMKAGEAEVRGQSGSGPCL